MFKYLSSLFFTLAFFCSATFAQSPKTVVVTEQTFKVGALKEKLLHFELAKGDKLILNFMEKEGKKMKSVEVHEYQSGLKFSDYEISELKDKMIEVPQTSAYTFRFKNSSLAGRVCYVKIERVPASDSLSDFRTDQLYTVSIDTTWRKENRKVLLRTDTTYREYKQKVLSLADTSYVPLLNKELKLSSLANSVTHIQGRTTNVKITLPVNTSYPNAKNPYKQSEVLSWSYWIGVGPEAKVKYEKENQLAINVIGVVSSVLLNDYAALIRGGLELLNDKNSGDNVVYTFDRVCAKDSFRTFDSGNVTSAAGVESKMTQGSFVLRLKNDNYMTSVDVNVRMVAKVLNREWKDQLVRTPVFTPVYEQREVRTPSVSYRRIPVSF